MTPDLCEVVNRRFPTGSLGILVGQNRGATNAQRLCRACPGYGRRRAGRQSAGSRHLGPRADRQDRSRQQDRHAGFVCPPPCACVPLHIAAARQRGGGGGLDQRGLPRRVAAGAPVRGALLGQHLDAGDRPLQGARRVAAPARARLRGSGRASERSGRRSGGKLRDQAPRGNRARRTAHVAC